jgi:hypothetical protein
MKLILLCLFSTIALPQLGLAGGNTAIAELEQFQHLGFELGCVSLAGLHFHSVLGSYVRGPEV